MAVVVRWFGGTKLGKGGLSRAYGGAARLALAGLPIRIERERVRLMLELGHEQTGAVRRLIRPPAVELVAESYGARVEIELAVEVEQRAALESALADIGLQPRAIERR